VIIGESSGEKYTPIPQELVGEWHVMSADGLISYGGVGFTSDEKCTTLTVTGALATTLTTLKCWERKLCITTLITMAGMMRDLLLKMEHYGKAVIDWSKNKGEL